MSKGKKALTVAGIVLQVLVGAAMILAGSGKALGGAPPEITAKMAAYGMTDKVALIGWGEMIAAVVMILPWTAGLGTLAVSGFWGGVICIHMSHGEDYTLGIVFMIVTWVGAVLRIPALRPEIGHKAVAPTTPAE